MISRKLLLAGVAALPLIGLSAAAAADRLAGAAPIVLALADIGDAMARLQAAEQAVAEAQAALTDAQTNGGDVAAAQAQLDAAQNELQAAQAAAEAAQQQPAPEEATPPPAPEEVTPPVEDTPPPPPVEEVAPPPEETPPPETEAPAAPQEEAVPPAGTQPQDVPAQPEQTQQQDQTQQSDQPQQSDLPRHGRPQRDGQSQEEHTPVQPAAGSDALPAEDVPPPPPPGEALQAPPPPPPTGAAAEPVGTQTDQGQVVDQAEGGRTIFRTGDNQLIIQHNDQGRIERGARDVETVDLGAGFTASILTRNSGVKIITVRDPDGNIIQRVRREPDGTETVLIGGGDANRDIYQGGHFRQDFRPEDFHRHGGQPDRGFEEQLPPLQVQIPQDQYVVEAQRASEPEIQAALVAPPLQQVQRPYTLEEIRSSGRLRDMVRRIDLDTVTFETNSAAVPPDQIDTLEQIGRALQAVIDRDPSQVFLIEGHTDAVGSDLYNLQLSDRRAESVASILSTYFAIPPENLVTQGYGEQYLKIPTQLAERQNRRVTLRNITQLLQSQN